jgi:pimeloyl-ACP methyl ester carboxylesterase
MSGFHRRTLLFAGAIAATTQRAFAAIASNNPHGSGALPSQAPAREGYVQALGARLYYWDTGGNGAPLVLAHAGTGSALAWGYQQPVFAAAGYRVIAFSRRGYARTEIQDGAVPHNALDDIDALAEQLRLPSFHALGTAAGGGIMLDYAIARPDRVQSLIVASAIGNIGDPAYQEASRKMYPPAFHALPIELQELGPFYRAANPEGVARWIELVRKAGKSIPDAPRRKRTTWTEVAALPMPVLWMTGGADMLMPPPLLARFHKKTPGSEYVIVDNAGHSIYWERPQVFNATVLAFLRRRGARPQAMPRRGPR